MLKCWFEVMKAKEQCKDPSGLKGANKLKKRRKWIVLIPKTTQTTEWLTTPPKVLACQPGDERNWATHKIYRRSNVKPPKITKCVEKMQANWRSKGVESIVRSIGGSNIDCLKLQCILNKNLKQEDDGQGLLFSRRPVGKAWLCSPIFPKRSNFGSV